MAEVRSWKCLAADFGEMTGMPVGILRRGYLAMKADAVPDGQMRGGNDVAADGDMEDMKVCRACKQSKLIGDFYKHPDMKDGHLNQCKVCVRSKVKDWKAANVERTRECLRGWRARNPGRRKPEDPEVVANRHRRWRDTNRDKVNGYTRRWKLMNPDKRKAQTKLHNAIVRGRIVPGPCVECGDPRVDGHHEDYGRPLDVVWLCRKHHRKLHGEGGLE